MAILRAVASVSTGVGGTCLNLWWGKNLLRWRGVSGPSSSTMNRAIFRVSSSSSLVSGMMRNVTSTWTPRLLISTVASRTLRRSPLQCSL